MALAGYRRFLIWTGIPLLVTQLGCAARGVHVPPPSEQVRASLGTIGVVAVASPTEVKLWTPGGAKAGARDGAKAAASVFALPYGVLLGFAFYGAGFVAIPAIGAMIGAAVGAGKAPPASEVKKAEAEVKASVAEARIQEAIRYYVLQRLRGSQPHWSVLLDLDADSASRHDVARYRAAHGIDTVLEVGVTTLEASGRWGVNPRGALVLTAHARLVRVADGVVLYERDFGYGGAGPGFGDWAEDTPRFYEELGRALEGLARQIVREFFGDMSPRPADEGQLAR